MDDYNKAFIIVFCFLLLGLFVIVPIVLLVYSHNLRMFYLYEGLSFSNKILICYCLAVLVGAGIFLYYIYKNQKEEKVTNINKLITDSIKNYNETKDAIKSLIGEKLAEDHLTNDDIKSLIGEKLANDHLTNDGINSLINQKLTDNHLTDDLIQSLINLMIKMNVNKEALTTFIQDTLKAKSIIS